MKTLGMVISLEGLNFPPEEKRIPQEFVCTVIKNCILLAAQQTQQRGLAEENRRKYYKICDLLDKAVVDKAETVELEDDWMGLIRKSFHEININPDGVWRKVEEKVLEVKDR